MIRKITKREIGWKPVGTVDGRGRMAETGGGNEVAAISTGFISMTRTTAWESKEWFGNILTLVASDAKTKCTAQDQKDMVFVVGDSGDGIILQTN